MKNMHACCRSFADSNALRRLKYNFQIPTAAKILFFISLSRGKSLFFKRLNECSFTFEKLEGALRSCCRERDRTWIPGCSVHFIPLLEKRSDEPRPHVSAGTGYAESPLLISPAIHRFHGQLVEAVLSLLFLLLPLLYVCHREVMFVVYLSALSDA